MSLHTATTLAIAVWLLLGFLGWRLAKAASREMPEHPGPRTPERGLGLDPGGGDDGPVPRREPAAGPDPYDHYTDRHPAPDPPNTPGRG